MSNSPFLTASPVLVFVGPRGSGLACSSPFADNLPFEGLPI